MVCGNYAPDRGRDQSRRAGRGPPPFGVRQRVSWACNVRYRSTSTAANHSAATTRSSASTTPGGILRLTIGVTPSPSTGVISRARSGAARPNRGRAPRDSDQLWPGFADDPGAHRIARAFVPLLDDDGVAYAILGDLERPSHDWLLVARLQSGDP